MTTSDPQHAWLQNQVTVGVEDLLVLLNFAALRTVKEGAHHV